MSNDKPVTSRAAARSALSQADSVPARQKVEGLSVE